MQTSTVAVHDRGDFGKCVRALRCLAGWCAIGMIGAHIFPGKFCRVSPDLLVSCRGERLLGRDIARIDIRATPCQNPPNTKPD